MYLWRSRKKMSTRRLGQPLSHDPTFSQQLGDTITTTDNFFLIAVWDLGEKKKGRRKSVGVRSRSRASTRFDFSLSSLSSLVFVLSPLCLVGLIGCFLLRHLKSFSTVTCWRIILFYFELLSNGLPLSHSLSYRPLLSYRFPSLTLIIIGNIHPASGVLERCWKRTWRGLNSEKN